MLRLDFRHRFFAVTYRVFVIDEEVGSIFGVCLCLAHPNCSNFTILAENITDFFLIRKLRIYRKRHKERFTVIRSQVVVRQVTDNIRSPFIEVAELHFDLL